MAAHEQEGDEAGECAAGVGPGHRLEPVAHAEQRRGAGGAELQHHRQAEDAQGTRREVVGITGGTRCQEVRDRCGERPAGEHDRKGDHGHRAEEAEHADGAIANEQRHRAHARRLREHADHLVDREGGEERVGARGRAVLAEVEDGLDRRRPRHREGSTAP